MKNYIELKKTKLCRAKIVEKYLMDNIEWYRNETDPLMKGQITFFIQPILWFICSNNKYKCIRISSEFWNNFLDDPDITMSFSNLEARKDVAKRLFDTYDHYNWKGDGLTIEKIINDFEFSILTSKETSPNYQGKPNLLPISVDMVEKIIKYQTYWKKGWFKNRKLRTYDEVKKIPLGKRFRKEEVLVSHMMLS